MSLFEDAGRKQIAQNLEGHGFLPGDWVTGTGELVARVGGMEDSIT